MFTTIYCPKCGLRLRETGTRDAVDSSLIVCRNGHIWRWAVSDDFKSTLTEDA